MQILGSIKKTGCIWIFFGFSVVSVFACVCQGAKLESEIGDNGELKSIKVNGELCLQDFGLLIVKPGWVGFGSQRDYWRCKATKSGSGGVWRFAGKISSNEGKTISFSERVEVKQNQIKVSYALKPESDLDLEAILLSALLPISKSALGGQWYVLSTDEPRQDKFPPVLPDNYVLYWGSGFDWFAWALKSGAALKFTPDWTGFNNLQLQDNRKFNTDNFEAQFYVKAGSKITPADTLKFSITIEAQGKGELEEQLKKTIQKTRINLSSEGKLEIKSVVPNKQIIGRYEKFELTLDLSATYSNPFDPEEIEVKGIFTAPSKRKIEIPGFLYKGYRRQLQGNAERLIPEGPTCWKIRFSPTEIGTYQYFVQVRDKTGSVKSAPKSFRVKKSQNKGFVRISQQNPFYFQFDSGEPYFALGENVCWPGSKGTYDYDTYWTKLSENGSNYARIWVGPFDCFTLERAPRGPQDYNGLGKYDLANSWRFDCVLQLAESKGIYIMFCIDSFNSLRFSQPYGMWESCPYNNKNGGPCEKPEEFFANEQAKKYYKRRLRYIISRWGYSTNILSWEFWNEVDIIEKYISRDATAWHQEMARYLRSIDPWKHLITTSFASSAGDPNVDSLPEIDYVQTHFYGKKDIVEVIRDWINKKTAQYKKPHYFGEFGLDAGSHDGAYDPTGINLHNGLWASALTPNSAGTAMLWYWDSFVEANNLYYHFKALSEFLKGVKWNKINPQPLQVASIYYLKRPEKIIYEDLTIDPDQFSWNKAPFNQPNTFKVNNDGTISNKELLSRLVHGLRNHPDLHNPATFEVNYPVAGKFSVLVDGVSGWGGANLRIYLDSSLVLQRDFTDPDDAENTDTLRQYDGAYSIEVPAGRHIIKVDNEGNDWFFATYQLTNYKTSDYPNLRVLGLQSQKGDFAILWLQNVHNNWYNYRIGKKLTPIENSVVEVKGLKRGEYWIEWWNTYRGELMRKEKATCREGSLNLKVPILLTDIACKIRLR